MKLQKEVVFDTIIASLLAGKYPAQIARELNISQSKIAYYTRQLKEQGLIKKIGYGVWQTTSNLSKVGHEVRGHGFLWKIKLPANYNWKKILKKKKIKHQLIGLGKFPRIMFKDRKIWLGQENLIIYEPESFFESSATEAKRLAIYKLLRLLRQLEDKLGTTLATTEGYQFKVRRQHFSLIKNSLAIQCNNEGKKIQVFNKKGLWFLIDNSYNLDEAETVHKDSAVIDNLGIQKYFNSHKKTNFQVTPQFVLEGFNKILQTENLNAQNIIKHQKVLDEMLVTLRKIQNNL